MKIAVASEGLNVASYYEHCQNYSFFTIDNGTIVDYRNLPSSAFPQDSAPEVLHDLGIDTIIVGCIAEPSRKELESRNISVFSGAMGDALESAQAYITNTFIATDEECVG